MRTTKNQDYCVAAEYELSDNYTETISQATVTERIAPALKAIGLLGRQISGRIETISDRRDLCYIVVKWPGSPEPDRREGEKTVVAEFPIELLEPLAALIPALVAQARRDGIRPQ